MQLEPGRFLGKYELISKLGAGAMGLVWRAKDPELGREIALKILPAEAAANVERVEHLRREARNLARLNHDNIVTVYSIEEAGGLHFLTMELVEGKTLEHSIPESGVAQERLLEWAGTLAGAMDAAHDSEIVHRDLKPANIMIRDDGRPIILDFGLAALRAAPDEGDPMLASTRSASIVREGAIAGTPSYMSPEQITGQPVDRRTDIFSLGVILYEIATAERPFKGDTFGQLQAAVLGDTPESVMLSRPDLDPRLDDVLSRCMAKRKEDRYQSAAELRDALERIQGTRPDRQGRRLRVVAVLIAVSLAGLGWLVASRWPEPQEQPRSEFLAVLPFENLTGNPELEYLSRGISRGLISQLADIGAIRVLGSSMFWDDAGPASSVERAKQRGASTILDGSVRRRNGRLISSIQLTQSSTGLVRWAGEFETDSDDPMEMQRQISREVARVFTVNIPPEELERVLREPTGSARAYDLLLRADAIIEKEITLASIQAAIPLLKQAVDLDREFATARARLSQALWRRYTISGNDDDLEAAVEESAIALKLDPDLPAAWVSAALVDRSRGRYEASIKNLKRTLSKHSRPAEAHLELAGTLAEFGDHATAEELFRRAAALEPEEWGYLNDLGQFYFKRDRWAEARQAFESAAEIAPDGIWLPQENIAGMNIQEGLIEEAIAIYEKMPRPIRNPLLASNIGTAYYLSDRAEKWVEVERYYELAVRLGPKIADCRRNLGDFYAAVDRRPEAVEQFRAALELTEHGLQINPRDPELLSNRPMFLAWTGRCEEAMIALERLGSGDDREPDTRVLFASASTYSLCGKTESAILAALEMVAIGWPCERLLVEPALAAVAGAPGVRARLGCETDDGH